MTRHILATLCLVGLAVSMLAPIQAQSASLRGQVTDESGAVVPGAKIVLNRPDGSGLTATAGNDGSYSFGNLPSGNYTVQASAPQLALRKPVNISLRAGAQILNLSLSVLVMVEKVTVEENNGPAVSTDPTNNAGALVLRDEDLLALSDDPDDLLTDLQALAGPSAGPSGGSIFVDGFSGGELPAKQSIREIRINQNPFSPEFDKLGYGRIEVFTKPGSDRYHATVDYNFAKDFWNSRNPFSAVKAPLLLDEFEGSGGGPINKRASFTLDAQRNMVDNGAIINAVTLNPQTLVAAPYFSTFKIPQRYTRATPRIDYQLNEKNTLIFRYSVTHSDIKDAGLGGFDLVSRAYDYQYTNQTVQVTETHVLGSGINETRFQYFRSASQRLANSQGPEIQVLGAFNDGGALVGRSFDTQNSFELQNYTSLLRGAHSWKFGVRLRAQTEDSISRQNFNGTFTFGGGLEPVLDANNHAVLDASGNPVLANISSIERYRRTLLFEQLGFSPASIRALGGGATQFSMNSGIPELMVHQEDVGLFVGDDWRVRPNVTVSLGLRYETQTNIHDWRDFAPRAAIAWALGGNAKGSRPKTVLRVGFGTFYDRFVLMNTLTAERFNGVVQQEEVISNPDSFPNIPTLRPGAVQSSVVQEVSSRFRAPYILQSAVTLERQLPANTTLAVTYTNSHAIHVLRSDDINAPLPGTYDPQVLGSGVFPLGRTGPVFLMESSGVYNQNQLIANINSRVNASFSLFGFYVFNKAMSNSDGLTTYPANPYNFAGEYGPAATDVRHRMTLGGSINTRWNVRLSPFVIVQTGPPFDITAGTDLYGTTLFNGRPGIAVDPKKAGLIDTKYGLLDPNPMPDEKLLPRNYGRGPGLITVNMRVSKSFGFGAAREGTRPNAGPSPSGGAVLGTAPASGAGIGRIIGTPRTSHRYNLILSMQARNVLNHTNPGPINGDITSPLFGRANQAAGSLNGEGFSENANNRRLEMQIRFTF